MALGLANNPSVAVPHLLVYVHTLVTTFIDDATSAEPGKAEIGGASVALPVSTTTKPKSVRADTWLVSNSSWVKKGLRGTERDTTGTNIGTFEIAPVPTMNSAGHYTTPGRRKSGFASRGNAHVVAEFALSLLHTAIRRGRLSANDATHVSLVNPFLPLIARLLKNVKATRVVTRALKIACSLFDWPLPCLSTSVPELTARVFRWVCCVPFVRGAARENAKITDAFALSPPRHHRILAGIGNSTGTDMAQACFRTITAVLRTHSEQKLTDGQAKVRTAIVFQRGE
jgi:hypothetical protein